MYYSVCMFFKSERTDKREPLWEERIVLVSALSEEEAMEKATRNCERESEFKTEMGTQIKWQFHSIERVILLDDLSDGTELFSRFLSEHEAKSLISKL
ncbi:DUF4288 domain-containing protein [Aliikangiella maris]|uniref:DUF4288 domain-containing protein n=2 Tax=Aliikangiella maris TaxID=3162458 RepID=A0ABV3MVH1_9GAMM